MDAGVKHLRASLSVLNFVVLSIFSIIFPKYDSARSQLIDIVDPLWHNVKANGFVFDKLHLVVAPRSDHTVTRKDDLLVKSALLDFLISTNRQL